MNRQLASPKSSLLQTPFNLNYIKMNEKPSPHLETFSPSENRSTAKQTESPYSKYFVQLSPFIQEKDELKQNKIDRILRYDNRSVDEAVLLYKQLKLFHFFKSFKNQNPNLRTLEALVYLSKILKYEYFQAGSMIYQKGEISNRKVYLVYSGEIKTWNNNQDPFNKVEKNELRQREHREKNKMLENGKNISYSTTLQNASKIKLFKLEPLNNIFPTQSLPSNEEILNETKSSQVINQNNQSILRNLRRKMMKSLLLNSSIRIIEKSKIYLNQRKQQFFEVNFDKNNLHLKNQNDEDTFLKKQRNNTPNIVDFIEKCSISSDRFSESEDGLNEKTERFIQRVLNRGRHFGEKTLKIKDSKREETAIAITDCELLSFTENDYKYLLSRFHSKNTSLLNFLLDCIPGLESTVKYQRNVNFELYFKEEEYCLHHPIITEKAQGSKIFLLYKGFCEIVKEMTIDTKPNLLQEQPSNRRASSVSKKFVICIIKPGIFIGEEILFNEARIYEQTIKVSTSKVKVFSIEVDIFKQIMSEEILNELQKLYLNKKSQNKELLSHKIKTSFSLKDQTSLSFYPFKDFHQYLPRNFSKELEEQKSKFILLNKYESILSRPSSSVRQSINSDNSSQVNLENKLHDELSKFEESLHQYWRIGPIKDSKLFNLNNIRNYKENSVFKNKPYFKKLIEEKILKEASHKVPSPLKFTTRAATKSMRISNEQNQKPISFKSRDRTVQLKDLQTKNHPKNGSLVLDPSLLKFCFQKDGINENQIEINKTTSNQNITTEISIKKVNLRNNLRNNIDSTFPKTDGSLLLSFTKPIETLENSIPPSTLENSEKFYSILNLPCFGKTKTKKTRKNLSFDLHKSTQIKKTKGI